MFPLRVTGLLAAASLIFTTACSEPSPPTEDTTHSPIDQSVTQQSSAKQSPNTTTDSSHQTPKQQTDAAKTNSNTIYWAKPGFKPLFILEGPLKSSGLGDRIFEELQKRMPQFNHVNTEANYPRIIMEARKKTEICAILHRTKEREAFMHFSNPVTITPSYQLYVSNVGKQSLDWIFGRDVKRERFDEILLRGKSLRMAITPKQSYGPDRDRVIQKYADDMSFVHNFTDQSALMKLLASDRIDMVLAFPWVFNYELDLLGLHSMIKKVHLTDMPAYQVSNIGCAKTPLGKQLVESINALTPKAHVFLEDVVPEWLNPEEIREYQQAYQEYFHGSGAVR